ncbi:2,3-bisphosphoglycerate-independent phosphoglycerate mutase [Clostridia bacterium]|nr:2,3-bisphosphoglycerate-independent phosphoglycerate mutase [Clostridia bacterium]
MVTLIIMDGFGLSKTMEGNAIAAAKTPNLDAYQAKYPYTSIEAAGLAVGLPDGQMGNSEVGHMNIGAGRVVYQDLTLISKSIADGDFYNNPAFLGAVANCKQHGSALHLMGLLSDGGVHSHNSHLYALLKLAKDHGIDKVFVHAFLDGRDVPPQSAEMYIRELQDKMAEIGVGKIATLVGRYNIMDRDFKWERIQKGYNALVLNEGARFADPIEGLKASYAAGRNDEFVDPIIIEEDGEPIARVREDDSIIFFNFRKDRAKQITRAFADNELKTFERKFIPNIYFVEMCEYDHTIPNVHVAYKQGTMKNNLGEYLSSLGKKNFRVAETEKFNHITFYFNALMDVQYPGEDRMLLPSDSVETFDLAPKMRAQAIATEAINAIKKQDYDFGAINLANPDMLGHTGIFDAAVEGVEEVDKCVGEIVDAVLAVGGIVLITADHGNAEVMVDHETGLACTSHTNNPVPLYLIGAPEGMGLRAFPTGKLADLAPTILELMDIEKPAEMTGESLLTK